MIVATAPELSQKCDFFQKKKMKGILVYVLEFMLTFDKMPKTCVKRPLSKRPKIDFQEFLSSMKVESIAAFLQYFRPSFSYHLS